MPLPRPTRKAYALTAGAVVLFVIGANVQAGWLYVLGASILGVALAGVALPPLALRGTRAARSIPAAAVVGDRLSVRLQVEGRAALVKGRDHFLQGADLLAEALPATFEYSVEARRRGIYEGGDVELRTGFPFGTGTARRTLIAPSPLVVHPRWVELTSFPLLESVSTPNEPLHDRRRRGAGMDFYGIREYRSGDSLRHVHWRSVARTGRLLVREYEEEPASRLGILIDSAEKAGSEPQTSFEDAVSCAASLVMYALWSGHPVQLFCEGAAPPEHLFEPGRIEALDWLSRVEAAGGRGLADAARRMSDEIQPRSTNVLIFPSTQRSAGEALEAVSILQGLSTRVVAIVLSARSYDEGHPSALGPQDEDALIDQIVSTRAIAYRVAGDKDLSESLREPCHA